MNEKQKKNGYDNDNERQTYMFPLKIYMEFHSLKKIKNKNKNMFWMPTLHINICF